MILEQLHEEKVQDVFCLCSKGELTKYRTPWLLQELTGADINVHHHPFPDGETPTMAILAKLLDELKVMLLNNRKTLIQ